ncbi:hypothetical protein ACH4TU_32095 [Streptomyces physcomitrii]
MRGSDRLALLAAFLSSSVGLSQGEMGFGAWKGGVFAAVLVLLLLVVVVALFAGLVARPALS